MAAISCFDIRMSQQYLYYTCTTTTTPPNLKFYIYTFKGFVDTFDNLLADTNRPTWEFQKNKVKEKQLFHFVKQYNEIRNKMC